MNTTKLFLFLALITHSTLSVHAQRFIEGVFQEVTEIWAYEHSVIEFFIDGTFYYEKSSDFGEFQGYGEYNLSRDSIDMLFHEVPIGVRTNRIAEEENIKSGGTTIQIRDGVNSHYVVKSSYSLYSKDSLIRRGQSDMFGNIYIDSGMTDVRVVINGFGNSNNFSNRFYGTQNLELEHTNARSFVVLFAYRPAASQYIKGGRRIQCKARLNNGGNQLRLSPSKADFFHPSGKPVTYALIRK